MSKIVNFISIFMMSVFTFVACLVVYLLFFRESHSMMWFGVAVLLIVGIGIFLQKKMFEKMIEFYESHEMYNYDVEDLETDTQEEEDLVSSTSDVEESNESTDA